MADGHGGYRRPAHPAPVSGPGAHSRRTDGRQPVRDLPNAGYGDNAAYRDIQNAAPLPEQAQPSAAPLGGGGAVAPPQVVPLGAPSMQPNTPVTAGAAYGPGPGPSALSPVSSDKLDAQGFVHYLPVLLEMANTDSTPASVKRAIRILLANS